MTTRPAATEATATAPAGATRPTRARRTAKPAADKPVPARRARAAAPKAPGAPSPKAPAGKAAKTKLVRDSFTMPSDEYGLLDRIKQRALAAARPAKKSEVLRAGLKVLADMDDAALMAALAAVPTIKTGRPKGKTAGRKG